MPAEMPALGVLVWTLPLDLPRLSVWPQATATAHPTRLCVLFWQEATKLPKDTPEDRDR